MTDGAWSVLNKIILTVDVCTSLAASYASGYCDSDTATNIIIYFT